MRAVGIKAFGGPEVVEVLTVDQPEPGPGQVRVRVMFAGVSTIDVHVRRGSFAGGGPGTPAGPVRLGYEGAGVVDKVGEGVEGIKPGDRVAWCASAGSQGELAIVPAWRLVPVPEDMPLDIACALQLDGALAHAVTISAFPVRAGDWLLVQGGGSVPGSLLIQVAKAQGAKVIATVTREEDRGAAEAAGADHVLVASGDALVSAVREITQGQGCNAVLDGIGNETVASSIACCRRRGVVILYGVSGTPVRSVSPDQLAAAGSVFLSRLHLPDYMQDQTEVRWRTGDLFGAWQSGHLKINIGRILPIEGAREAHTLIEGQTPVGKIMLKIAG